MGYGLRISPSRSSVNAVARVSDSDPHLWALLRRLRKEAGLRQKDLAQRLGRPQSYVSKYEAGERKLDLIELRAIAEALDLSLSEVVRRFEAMQ